MSRLLRALYQMIGDSQMYLRFLAHLSRRLIRELIVYRSSRRPCVRPCVHPLTLSNMNISATSWPIGMKFYLKHHWGGGKASVGFDPDRIRTLVSMTTDNSHRVIMGKRRHHVLSNAFDRILSILSGNDDMRASMSSKFSRIRPRTTELAALECMKKNPIDL